MKKLLIAGVVAALSFAIGLAGLYHLVPVVAPERAAEAQLFVDSLMAAGVLSLPGDSAAALPSAAAAPDPAAPAADTTGFAADAFAAGAFAEDTALADAGPMADSVRALQERLRLAERERDALQARAGVRSGAQKASDEEIAELAGTLATLEDRELGAILAQLDIDIVRSLYDRTSARNRARLLKAMPAERAARFVQRVVQPDRADAAPGDAATSNLAASATNTPAPRP